MLISVFWKDFAEKNFGVFGFALVGRWLRWLVLGVEIG